MTPKTRKAVFLGAVIGAGLAIVFRALGAISPEPSDHALDPTGGLIPFLLLPFCLPAFLLHGYLVSPILWWAFPYMRFGRLAEWLETFVTYPALQAVVYGAAVWLCVGMFQHFRKH